jgi:hypothetical protein
LVAFGRAGFGFESGFHPDYRFDQQGPPIMALVHLWDQGLRLREGGPGLGLAPNLPQGRGVYAGLLGLRVFPARKVVVDHPIIFPDPNI